MADHQGVRGYCYSAHRELGAVAFFPHPKSPQSETSVDNQDDKMDIDYTKWSASKQDDKMDQSNDRASVYSGTTASTQTTRSLSSQLRGKWWQKRDPLKQERQEQEEREAQGQMFAAEQLETERLESIGEAVGFLEEFVRNGWPSNFENGQVKIHCNLTMDEVKGIGHLNRIDGTKECRDLFTAPFIHDAMGGALYEILSAQVPKELLDMITEEDDTVAMTEENTVIGAAPSKVEKRKRGGSLPLDDRQTRSVARRATEGDVIPVVRRSSSARAITMSERNRRRSVSGEVLVRPDQVLCTTCGSRAMGIVAEDETMTMDEDEGTDEERHVDKKRMSLSRRISVKMGEKLTSIGGDVASGYGGSRLMV